MERKGLSQEGLKLIACGTMLIDHIGAALVPVIWMRVVGRIAFPIYCFLLAEGVYRTRDPKNYGLRLVVGMLLAEVPFELLLFGRFNGMHTSVMVTLLLGFLYGIAQKKTEDYGWKLLLLVPFIAATELLHTDYGGAGVAMIAVFLLIRNGKRCNWLRTVLLAAICLLMDSFRIRVAGFRIPIEIFAVLAMIPIAAYSGKKWTYSKVVQTVFYLFYPVHLAMLLLIRSVI